MTGIIVTILIFSIITTLAILLLVLVFVFSHKEKLSKILNTVKFYRAKHQITSSAGKIEAIDVLADTLSYFSKNKIGALIVFEQKDSLDNFKENGFRILSDISEEFIISIFSNKKATFHDGAMIIKKYKIECVSSYLPISKTILDLKYGARHRAAIGVTEVTDSIAIACSETSGLISISKNGNLISVGKNKEQIKEFLQKLI